jgi:hypothetical protein
MVIDLTHRSSETKIARAAGAFRKYSLSFFVPSRVFPTVTIFNASKGPFGSTIRGLFLAKDLPKPRADG